VTAALRLFDEHVRRFNTGVREQPPDDEIDILDVREEDGVVRAGYAWRRDAGMPAGELRLTPVGDRIGRLVVTFESG